jgi:hypothetical protein
MYSNEHEGNVECVAGTTCRHHWIVDSTDNAVAKGVCRVCGEERKFENGFHTARPRPQRPSKPAPSPDDSVDLDLQA